MTVFITNEQDKIEIPAEWEEKINQVAAICLREEQLPEDVEVDLLFVDNEAIREMNLEYRDKDSATDVLSFPMYEPDEEIDDEEYDEDTNEELKDLVVIDEDELELEQ